MVRVKTLELRNFRGASKVKIDLSGSPGTKVVTLIGLNESGKTTVLEGLAQFPSADRAAASMFQTPDANALAASFVPVHETGMFSGTVRIFGRFETNDDDRRAILEIVKNAGLELDNTRQIEKFDVTKTFEFNNGDFVEGKYSSSWFGIDLYVRKSKRSEFKRSVLPELGTKDRDKSLWIQTVDYLKTKLPNVVYFPNVVVDIPKRIYIAKFDDETLNNSYYRRAVEYILADGGLSLKDHVLDRIDRHRAVADKGWITNLLGSDDRDKIDAVFTRLSSVLTTEVIGSWSKVFNRPISANRVEVKWFVDTANEQPFIELKVSDGRSSYHLHQRSLGFRWFFSFQLFTRFGRDREKTNIFLFDEPAANLHAKAQGELLNSFKMLAESGDFVIYSTHSHHMIDPSWLPGAYIVENAAIDYDNEDKGVLGSTKDTDITVTPYRQFVGKHGNRISYYQPVLESLAYVEPQILPQSAQILVEGPSDFYAFNYALRRSPHAGRLTIVPGSGAGTLDTLISIALARGHAFVVLLDDDDAGRKEADRYRKLFHLTSDTVVTLGDIDVSVSGKALESLVSKDTIAKIVAQFGNSKKRSIGLYMAEAAATNADGALSDETLARFSQLIENIAARLLSNNNS